MRQNDYEVILVYSSTCQHEHLKVFVILREKEDVSVLYVLRRLKIIINNIKEGRMRKCAWPRVVSDSLFAKGETKGKNKK